MGPVCWFFSFPQHRYNEFFDPDERIPWKVLPEVYFVWELFCWICCWLGVLVWFVLVDVEVIVVL